MRLYNLENDINEVPEWVQQSFEGFRNTMSDNSNPFPCHFAKTGIEKSSFRYTYIKNGELKKPEIFKEALVDYLNRYKSFGWPSVLVVFIENNGEASLDVHESAFWNILQYLVSSDNRPWPIEIPNNPENYKWQFCFHGTPLFITGHSSVYKKRRSRHCSSDMMMVIQTMETLQPVTGGSKRADLVRKTIRNRVNEYDEIPVSPLIGAYPDRHSREWKQFWLPEENNDKKQCPLHFSK
ncbi:YqcI/YcgG family protein [Cognatitamlana onchidii]|uniref:YqcI/YcgG family protein n=1 Tax=Cognatitamlana onchidii TaxID=2562860 RepID=UPI001455F38A|nr:YqcI/YcgG family protein [Algibacter onchidii]